MSIKEIAADGRPHRGGRGELADAVVAVICDVHVAVSVHRHAIRRRELAAAYGPVVMTRRAIAADGRPHRAGRGEHAYAVVAVICDVDVVASVHRHASRRRELAAAYGPLVISRRAIAADGRPQRGGRGELADAVVHEISDVHVAASVHRHASRRRELADVYGAVGKGRRAVAADGRPGIDCRTGRYSNDGQQHQMQPHLARGLHGEFNLRHASHAHVLDCVVRGAAAADRSRDSDA